MQDRPNMSINGKDDEKNTGSSSNQVHYVPFKVEFEGSANVSTKFSSKSTRIENSNPESDFEGEEFKNQFHGKPLNGKQLVIPDDYEGIIAIDAAKEPSVKNDKETKFRRVGGFSSLTYWNWDKPASTMDAPVKLMDWLELSQKLHEPIGEES